jgi:hypothetical protein
MRRCGGGGGGYLRCSDLQHSHARTLARGVTLKQEFALKRTPRHGAELLAAGGAPGQEEDEGGLAESADGAVAKGVEHEREQGPPLVVRPTQNLK